MTDTKKNQDEKQNNDQKRGKPVHLSEVPNELSERGRQIWLAGLGALSRVEEEGEKIFHDLIERGQEFEDRGRKQIEGALAQIVDQQKQATGVVDSATESATQTFTDAAESVERTVSNTLTDVLGRAGMPTRDEVEELSTKVGQLSEKLDALSAALEAQDTDAIVYHVTPHEDGWAVLREGVDEPISAHDTKQEALEEARETAKSNAPSELIVHKKDRSVQETYSYEASESD